MSADDWEKWASHRCVALYGNAPTGPRATPTRQKTDFSCGPAALATALDAVGIRATEEELSLLATTDQSGTSAEALLRAAIERGANAELAEPMNETALRREIERGHPVLLAIQGWGDPSGFDAGHWVTAVATLPGGLVVADPSDGRKWAMSWPGLARRWHALDGERRYRVGIVLRARRPGRRPAPQGNARAGAPPLRLR